MLKKQLPIILILVVCFIFRLSITSYGTFGPDLGTFYDWSNRVVSKGFSGFYSDWSDYLPGYIYVLWFLKSFVLAFHLSLPNEVLYKLPSILSDAVTVLLIYLIVKKIKSRRAALTGAFIYSFSPSIFGNSAMWGQVDSFSTMFLALSFYFFTYYIAGRVGGLVLSGLFLGLGLGMKPTGVFLAFIYFVMLLGIKDVKKIFYIFVPAILVFLQLFVPFSVGHEFFPFVFERVAKSISQHSSTCLNSYNFWMVATGCWKDASRIFLSMSFREWGALVFAVISLILILWGRRMISKVNNVPNKVLYNSLVIALVYMTGYLYLTGIHERHIYPVFVFLAVASCLKARIWMTYLVLTLLSFVNLMYAQAWFSGNRVGIYGVEVSNLFSFIMIGVWAYLIIELIIGVKDGRQKTNF